MKKNNEPHIRINMDNNVYLGKYRKATVGSKDVIVELLIYDDKI